MKKKERGEKGNERKYCEKSWMSLKKERKKIESMLDE